MVNVEYTGKRILDLRQAKGWTQKQLAEILGVTDKAVSKWERGINYPDLSLLEPLAKALETTVPDLLGLEDSPESNAALETTTKIWMNEKEELKSDFRRRIINNIGLSVLIMISALFLVCCVCDEGLPYAVASGIFSSATLILCNGIWILKKYKRII